MLSEVDKLIATWAENDEAEVDEAIRAMFQHRSTRRMLWWLLQIGKFGTQPFARNALDTAFGCGELNVGQQLADRIIKVDPAGFVNLMKENADERSSRDTALGNARDTDRDNAAGGYAPSADA